MALPLLFALAVDFFAASFAARFSLNVFGSNSLASISALSLFFGIGDAFNRCTRNACSFRAAMTSLSARFFFSARATASLSAFSLANCSCFFACSARARCACSSFFRCFSKSASVGFVSTGAASDAGVGASTAGALLGSATAALLSPFNSGAFSPPPTCCAASYCASTLVGAASTATSSAYARIFEEDEANIEDAKITALVAAAIPFM